MQAFTQDNQTRVLSHNHQPQPGDFSGTLPSGCTESNLVNQPTLFELDYGPAAPVAKAIEPIDPKVEPVERPRLRGQNATILAMLQEGPKTNRELAEVALNYRARVSDLRAAGHTIEVAEDKATGLNVYELKGEQ